MAVIRVNKSKDYTTMSNIHLRDVRLSLKAKGLLSVMLSLPDNWEYSIAGLVAISKEEETAIKSTLKELKSCGYVVVKKFLPGETKSGRIEYEYNIFECPQEQEAEAQKIEKQEAEKQPLENLPIEVQAVENQGQLNTKELNTKELNTKDKKKESKKESASFDTILSGVADDGLRELYVEFIKMRKLIKAPMTNRALEMLISKVDKLEPSSVENKKKLLENAILNNWKSVYALRPEDREKPRQSAPKQAVKKPQVRKKLPTLEQVAAFREQIRVEYPGMEERQYKSMAEAFERGEWDE